jgi:hypothetical protein
VFFSDDVSCIHTGARIEYLPPYSPDFHPIKESFSTLEQALRKRGIFGDSSTPMSDIGQTANKFGCCQNLLAGSSPLLENMNCICYNVYI